MKYTPLLLFLFLIACGGETEELVIPEDIEEKRELLKEKRTALNAEKEKLAKLEEQVAELQAAIQEQDPAFVKKSLVTTMQVEPTDFERFTEVQGTVKTDDNAAAVSEIGGRITRLTVEEGDRVRKGQLIATIDMEGIDKQRAELQTALGLAEEVYERQKRLWDQNIGSEIQFLQAKNNKERLEKSLETLNFQQTKANVYAPISGSVEMLMTKQGEVAAPGVPIVQILNTKEVKVVAEVPETLLRSVKTGEKVRVEFPALGRTDTIKITQIGRTINPANRTFSVEAELKNPDGELKPNLLAVIHLNDFSAPNVITLPLNRIQQEVTGKSFVMTVGPDNKAQKTYVETGESFNGEVIIKSGITPETVLVDKGARTVKEGDVLEVEKG